MSSWEPGSPPPPRARATPRPPGPSPSRHRSRARSSVAELREPRCGSVAALERGREEERDLVLVRAVLEPPERVERLREPEAHGRVERRELDGLLRALERLRRVAPRELDPRQRVERLGRAGRLLDRRLRELVRLGEGLLRPLVHEDPREVVARDPVPRLELEHGAIRGLGVLRLPELV